MGAKEWGKYGGEGVGGIWGRRRGEIWGERKVGGKLLNFSDKLDKISKYVHTYLIN